MQLLWPLVGAVVGYVLCRVPAIKRKLIPKARAAQAVDSRAFAAFTPTACTTRRRIQAFSFSRRFSNIAWRCWLITASTRRSSPELGTTLFGFSLVG